jgi:hypothetical protein
VGNVVVALRVAFAPGVPYFTNAFPVHVQVADFDRDGALDFVTADSGVPTISVLRGNGDGTFQPRVILGTGPAGTTQTTNVAVGDLNADGNPDILSANNGGAGSGTLSVLLGVGNGTFLAPQHYAAGSGLTGPGALAVADMDGDGDADVVRTNNGTPDVVAIFLGNGDGTLATTPLTTAITDPSDVAVAELSGDGIPDVVVGGGGQSVAFFAGNGDGTLAAPSALATPGTVATAVATGDLDADGDLDVVASNGSSTTESVFLGNGNGMFAAQQTYPVTGSPIAMTVADLNGDGFDDVITGGLNSGFVHVLLAEGNGTLLPEQVFDADNSPGTSQLFAVAVADLNEDDLPDVLAVGRNSSQVFVLLQQE